jgi:hypothetical protein
MSSRNKKGLTTRNTATSPVRSKSKTRTTYEGGEGYARDAKSELYRPAVDHGLPALAAGHREHAHCRC